MVHGPESLCSLEQITFQEILNFQWCSSGVVLSPTFLPYNLIACESVLNFPRAPVSHVAVTPADGMVLSPGMFGYGRLVDNILKEHGGESEEGRPPPYVAGISEWIRRVCKNFNTRVVFKSGPTRCSLLTKVKDTLPMEKQENAVYEVPCTCVKM